MNRKKTLQAWQMIVSVVLLAAMLITLFLPAFQFNGKAARKAIEKVVPKEMLTLGGALGGFSMDDIEKEVDQEVRNFEEECNVKLSSISMGTIMMKSAEQFLGGKENIEENDLESLYESLKSGWGSMRMMFWIIYIVDILIMVLLILGFVLGWNKIIPLALDAVYAVAVAGIFGVIRFVSPGMGGNAFSGLDDMLSSLGVSSADIAGKAGEMLACFYGSAYIIGIVIAVLLLIMSVVCMVVGNQEWITLPDGRKMTPEEYHRMQEEERQRAEWDEQQRQKQMQLEQEERERKKQREAQERQRQMEEQQKQQKQQAQAAMGQVMCIKGVATGQGFSLPETSKVVVGKNPQYANLLIQSPHVSNVHCSIRYKAATNTYIVKDHSSNGTYVNGVRLQKDVPLVFPAGTVLQLADGSNEIRLG